MNISLDQVYKAQQQIANYIVQTPIVTNSELNKNLGCEIFWKLENLQRTNAFKIRGALNCILQLKASERACGVVAASSGNHGIGVAFAASILGVSATVVMPQTALAIKQDKIRNLGATIMLHGNTFEDATHHATMLASSQNHALIPTFDNLHVIAGHATLAIELLDHIDNIDAVLVPIGGGGLAAGVGFVLANLKPSIKLYGIQAQAAPAAYQSYRSGKLMAVPPTLTLADGIAIAKPGVLTFNIIQRTIHNILLVDESAITTAVTTLANVLQMAVEPSSAVTLAAITAYPHLFARKRVVCVVSGGNTHLSYAHPCS